jgi:hypothetical protein
MYVCMYVCMYVMSLPLLSREDLKIVYGRNEHVIDRCIQYDEPAFALIG